MLVVISLGCAVGRIRGNQVEGWVIGVAKVERCIPTCKECRDVMHYIVSTPAPMCINPTDPEPTPDPKATPTPIIQQCDRIQGGSISGAAAGVLGAMIDGVIAYFSAGAI
jgi:hypothetical protein